MKTIVIKAAVIAGTIGIGIMGVMPSVAQTVMVK